MKVDKNTYDMARANDSRAIGLTLTIEMGDYSAEQRFIVEDAAQEVGRLMGNLISQLAAIPDSDNESVSQLSAETIKQLRKVWRGVTRA